MRYNEIDQNKNKAKRIYKIEYDSSLVINLLNSVQSGSINQCESNAIKMPKKSVSIFLLTLFYCALVNFVSAKTVPPAAIEPLPDMYSLAATYPGNNAVNYNASPNPQFSSNNFNNFNEPTPQPPLQILGSYQNMDYQQQRPVRQQKSQEELATENNPTAKNFDYSNELK